MSTECKYIISAPQNYMRHHAEFTAALKRYLRDDLGKEANDNEECYRELQVQMQQHGCGRSVWADISRYTNMTATQCHDFFHNTWVLQFYDSFKDYRPELREILEEAVAISIPNPAEFAKNELIKRHPEKSFYPHSLLQAAYVMLRRKRRPEAPRKREGGAQALTSGEVGQLRSIVFGWTSDELKRIL